MESGILTTIRTAGKFKGMACSPCYQLLLIYMTLLQLSELEGEQADIHTQQVLPLQEKLEALTIENTALRDANDELTLKLEDLASRHATKK